MKLPLAGVLCLAALAIVPAPSTAHPLDPPGPHRPWCKGPEPGWSHPNPCPRHHKFAVRRALARQAARRTARAETATATVEPAAPVAPAAPSGSCPAYMAGEASSPTATNPASGAYGCFQVIPSTAAAYGCDLSTMDGQYACMEAICAGQGNDAWSASGATPCG